jgi:hypothetical protein
MNMAEAHVDAIVSGGHGSGINMESSETVWSRFHPGRFDLNSTALDFARILRLPCLRGAQGL